MEVIGHVCLIRQVFIAVERAGSNGLMLLSTPTAPLSRVLLWWETARRI
jgi:hypothetical protein